MAIKKKGKKEETPSTEKESVFEEASTVENNEPVVDTTEVEEEGKAEEISMPISDVESLLKRMEERLSNKFNDKLQKLKLGKAKKELEEDEEYIADLEEDWLETPVVFFAYSINFSIHGDKQRGKTTAPPQGPVRFKPIIRAKRQGRKGEEIISVSSIKVHSKAVAEYLRGHSMFGISFFENMDSVLNMDSGWAQKLVEANQSIQRLSDQQIIARCRQENVGISTDIIGMRKALVEKIAEKAIARQKQINYGELKNAVIDKNDRQIVEKTIG